MTIDTLILEVTRRCNFKCDHCLRGRARNKNMSYEVIDKLFYINDITYIRRLCIGGGEPSLAPNTINYLVDVIKSRGIYVDCVDITVNGGISTVKQPFLDAVTKLLYLGEDSGENFFAISNTEWHDYQQDDDAIYDLEELFGAVRRGRIKPDNLYYEGMAAENCLTWDDPKKMVKKDCFSIQFDDERGNIESIDDGNLYINANGWVIPGCDFSYEHQERLKTINVMREPLSNLVRFKDYE